MQKNIEKLYKEIKYIKTGKKKNKSSASILSSIWAYSKPLNITAKLVTPIHAYTESQNTLNLLRFEASILVLIFGFYIFILQKIT